MAGTGRESKATQGWARFGTAGAAVPGVAETGPDQRGLVRQGKAGMAGIS